MVVINCFYLFNTPAFDLQLKYGLYASVSKAVDILDAYEGTLEDDYPPNNERCEHSEMLLYKVSISYANIIIVC